MKKILYSIGILMAMGLSSCDDSFIDQKNLFQASLDSYYQTPAQIEEAMGGVYNALYVDGPHSNEHVAANLLSDLMLGGGGPDDKSAKWVDNFEDPNEDTYKALWLETYNGVYRCNAIIEAVTTVDFSTFFKTEEEAEDFKNQAIGEAYFMRAFLMFRAAKFFGGMPIIPTTDAPRDVPRSSYEVTFGTIASDLKQAIETLPDVPANEISIDRYGHANKWVAEAYMARVFLFYTGYMTNIEKKATSAIILPEGEGTITKANVVAYLDDCMANSKFGLVDDFRNLWAYSHVNDNARAYNPDGTHPVLPWAETEGLAWAGQDGHNSNVGSGNEEVMFAQRYAFGNWDWNKGQYYNNIVCLYFGIRDNSMQPFGQGWGWGTIHPLLKSQWDDADERKQGSILDMGDADQGTGGYQNNKGDHETGMFNKKYTTIQHDGPDGVKGMFYYLYDMDHGDPMQLWAAQDFYYMRYADVLLMHSELTETADGMNEVRRRAGLTDTSYSLAALKEERKYEFAFEGLRWFDLVRWGDVENDANNYYSNEVDVDNSGVASKYSVQYRPVTKGLVPVPESEVRLSNGVYEQNPGW
ncbi:RagB/SusD family nutrient uptake outer membrane protein [Carboxylicivirga sp. N1Y90]|uniref:RagB/SusD family nutrient uptake outer membrane protein n=1 Tax=Carboxylicivirga fragile TaxID=3417571 RepID=UPI003D344B1B|nr:RagB/SusD family nutrient uptake outer membrane protein [Marinilabiliaceae bacterium N1Y90]